MHAVPQSTGGVTASGSVGSVVFGCATMVIHRRTASCSGTRVSTTRSDTASPPPPSLPLHFLFSSPGSPKSHHNYKRFSHLMYTSYVHTNTHTQTHIRTHMYNTCTHTHVCISTHTHTCTHTHTHVRTRTYTSVYTHAGTCTHTHTHTRNRLLPAVALRHPQRRVNPSSYSQPFVLLVLLVSIFVTPPTHTHSYTLTHTHTVLYKIIYNFVYLVTVCKHLTNTLRSSTRLSSP